MSAGWAVAMQDAKLRGFVDNFDEHNLQTCNLSGVVSDFGDRSSLYPAEAVLLEKYRLEIENADVLDIGVGGGRTTFHLLANCRSYRAVDYAPAMIEVCRRRFVVCPPETFAVGDVRDLATHADGAYRFVLLSGNSLDYIGHDDRLRALYEVRRVLARDGLFLFSTHSLHAYPFRDPMTQARNRHADPGRMAAQGWYHLIDYADRVVTHYVYPHVQLRELKAAGFATLDVLDLKGQAFDFASPPDDWMVHFMCRAI